MTTTHRKKSRRPVPTTEITEPATLTPLEHAGVVTSTFDAGVTRPLDWRRAQLKGIATLLDHNGPEIEEAVHADLGKPGLEALIAEISSVQMEIKDALKNLNKWAKPQRVGLPAMVMPGKGDIVPEPLGTVLIIAPWNYPVNLLLAPLVGAVAAGNAVILKPSELAPHNSAVMAKLIPRYLDRRAIRLVEGAVEETTELLTYPWDHVFYTGNGTVGRIVMEAAAKNLTPVTLELGGKSPVYIDETADIDGVAAWLAWGKFLNAGQTCVAPDYLLASQEVADKLVPAIQEAVSRMYGADPQKSADYGRMVNDRHLQRVSGLLDSGEVAFGGSVDPDDRFISPTVLTGVSLDDPVMQEEIFGPVLPVVTVADRDEAIDIINQRDKPLALYVFTEDAEAQNAFTSRTSSGGLVFNAVILHLVAGGLPFGGVGASGMGAYHGEHGFRTFSHEKSVLKKSGGAPSGAFKLAVPPFTTIKSRLMRGGKKE